jgi:site-specific DNA recombinase
MSPKGKTSKPVDIYVRVSRVRGRQGDSFISPKVQEERCRSYLDAHGLTAGEVFTDLDQSGRKASRPAFDKMKARVAAGESGGCVVYKLSRFGRSVRHVLQDVQWLEEQGAAFLCIEPAVDTSTAQGRFILTVFSALDELESDNIKVGWQYAHADALDRGVHIGPTPTGYLRSKKKRSKGKLVPDPEVGPVVAELFRLRASGEATDVELVHKVSEAIGRKVNRSMVRALLTNRVYLGEVHHNGSVQLEAHEPLIDAATFERAQRQTRKRGPRPSAPRRPLADVLRCPNGHRMSVSRNARGHFFRCGNPDVCDQRSTASVQTIEPYVLPIVLERYMGLSETQPTPDDRTPALEKAVQNAQEALSDVELLKGHITPAAWGKALSAAYEELEAVEQALADYTPPISLLPPKKVLDQLWELLTRDEPAALEQMRGLVNEVVETVEVGMGRLPVEEKLTIRFKDGDVYHLPKTATLAQELELPVQERVETLELLRRRRARQADSA